MIVGCNNEFEKISKEKITYKMPLAHSLEFVEENVVDFSIINSGDIFIYELPFRYSYESMGAIISDTIKYDYVIFNKNEEFGYLVRSFEDSFRLKVNIDSILSKRAYLHLNFDSLLSKALQNKLSKLENQASFKVSFKVIDARVDSMNFYFDDEQKNLKFSFSKKIDSAYNSKLFKVEFLYKKYDMPNADYINKFRLASFVLEKEEVKNRNEVQHFMSRFNKLGNLSSN